MRFRLDSNTPGWFELGTQSKSKPNQSINGSKEATTTTSPTTTTAAAAAAAAATRQHKSKKKRK